MEGEQQNEGLAQRGPTFDAGIESIRKTYTIGTEQVSDEEIYNQFLKSVDNAKFYHPTFSWPAFLAGYKAALNNK